MVIDLPRAAKILASTTDEVMFMVQSGDLVATIEEETMSWQFDVDEVLQLKEKLDKAKEMIQETANI